MKQLNKNGSPLLLEQFKAHNHPQQWNDLNEIRQELRQYILEEQGSCCAYTEIHLNSTENCHIDHYYTRNLYPEKTFDYSNMLVSCNSEDYAAKFKDKQIKRKEDYSNLIHPVNDNPSDYIEFTVTGKVTSVNNHPKGEYSISVFNLNEKTLVERRKTAINNLILMKDFLTEDEIVSSLGEFESMLRQLYKDLNNEN